MDRNLIAVDIAKDVFEIAGSTEPGKVAWRKRVRRKNFLEVFAKCPCAIVVMEACGSAHYWARRITELGHEVKLLPPSFTRRYVLGNKTDRTDTKGILEAYRNEEIHPVPIKTLEQQTLTTLHRFRSGWIEDRTAHVNALRGHLRELGFFIALGRSRVVPQTREWLADTATGIPLALRPFFSAQCDHIDQLTERIKEIEHQLEALAKQNETAELLMAIRGIGVLGATALVAWIGDIRRFKNARQFASYLGLVPREHSSGAKRWLGGISKRGDRYLRTLLVHGARSILMWAKRKGPTGRLEQWALEISTRRGYKRATVALAHKLARIVWVVWTRECPFRLLPLSEQAA